MDKILLSEASEDEQIHALAAVIANCVKGTMDEVFNEMLLEAIQNNERKKFWIDKVKQFRDKVVEKLKSGGSKWE